MSTSSPITDQVIVALRKVIRAIELHSRTLVNSHGLTGPQATLLNALKNGAMTAGDLADNINLSQGTVTDILNRLESRSLVERTRDTADKRRVIVTLTDKSREMLTTAPPLLQETFSRRFSQLPDWEQSQLLSSLQRIAQMMDVDDLEEAKLLASGISLHLESNGDLNGSMSPIS